MNLLRLDFFLFLSTLFLSLSIANQDKVASVACLPCTFESQLISCVLITENQGFISFYTDTGGKNFLYKSGKKKLGLKSKKGNLWESAEMQDLFLKNDFASPGVPEFLYVNDRKSKHDGMLGREWFADKVVQIDYSAEEFKLLSPSTRLTGDGSPLFFKEDNIGKPATNLARLEVEVEGDTLSLLLDTGAQAKLSEDMQEHTNQNRLVAISFINASVMDKWRLEHPHWEVFQYGDESFKTKEDIILVPSITIAGKKVGPVAFASREDYNFKNMSTLFMDQEIQGALGGNALAQLGNVIIDYPKRKLVLASSEQSK